MRLHTPLCAKQGDRNAIERRDCHRPRRGIFQANQQPLQLKTDVCPSAKRSMANRHQLIGSRHAGTSAASDWMMDAATLAKNWTSRDQRCRDADSLNDERAEGDVRNAQHQPWWWWWWWWWRLQRLVNRSSGMQLLLQCSCFARPRCRGRQTVEKNIIPEWKMGNDKQAIHVNSRI